jgi:hypothetical protein
MKISRRPWSAHLLSFRVRNRLEVEGRERHDHAGRIGLDRDLIGLANVDQEIVAFRHPLRHVLRRQIMHFVIRHA